MNSKTLVAAVLGGLAAFLTGWIIYGLVLKGTMESMMGTATGVMKTDDEMMSVSSMGFVLVGNIVFGYLLAHIFSKWANITTAAGGASAGAVLLGLYAFGYDLIMYGTTNMMKLPAVFIDTACSAIFGAVAGAVIGWWLGRGKS